MYITPVKTNPVFMSGPSKLQKNTPSHLYKATISIHIKQLTGSIHVILSTYKLNFLLERAENMTSDLITWPQSYMVQL